VPQNASGGEHVLQALAQSGRGVNYTSRDVLRAARADLAVEGFDLQPKGALREGNVATLQVSLRNQGDAPAPGALAVYVDDSLVGFDAGHDLQPGEEALVNVSFKVQHGEHVVLVAVDPGKAVGEDDEDNNALVKVLHVEGGAAFFAVPDVEPLLGVVAVVLLAAVRRRGPR
jgi:subtilase family serine protease